MASSPFQSTAAAATTPTIPNVRFTGQRPADQTELIIHYVNARVDGLRSEMKGEMATLAATVQAAEAQRSADYSALKTSVDTVRDSLPNKGTVWRVGGAFFGGLIALLALVWAVFDTGAALTSGFADSVLSDKKQQDAIETKLDRLLDEKRDDQSKASPRQR